MSLNRFSIILACLFASTTALASEIPSIPVVTVTAIGEVNVEPDEAVLTLRVEKFDREVAAAKQQHDRSVRDLIALVHGHGVSDRDIQTRDLRMEAVHEVARDAKGDDDLRRSGPVRGYLVSSTVMVRLTDLKRFEAFYSDLLGTGISEVKDVQLGDSKMRAHRETARELAVKAAREKAVAMAGVLGQTVGKAVEITEGEGSLFNFGYSNAASRYDGLTPGGGDTGTFAPGSIRITATVRVSFKLD